MSLGKHSRSRKLHHEQNRLRCQSTNWPPLRLRRCSGEGRQREDKVCLGRDWGLRRQQHHGTHEWLRKATIVLQYPSPRNDTHTHTHTHTLLGWRNAILSLTEKTLVFFLSEILFAFVFFQVRLAYALDLTWVGCHSNASDVERRWIEKCNTLINIIWPGVIFKIFTYERQESEYVTGEQQNKLQNNLVEAVVLTGLIFRRWPVNDIHHGIHHGIHLGRFEQEYNLFIYFCSEWLQLRVTSFLRSEPGAFNPCHLALASTWLDQWLTNRWVREFCIFIGLNCWIYHTPARPPGVSQNGYELLVNYTYTTRRLLVRALAGM